MPNPSTIAMAEEASQPRLIGLHGRKGAGKDATFSAIFAHAESREQVGVRRAFADTLKDLAMYVLHLPRNEAEEFKVGGTVDSRAFDGGVSGHLTGRLFLQELGLGARQIVNPDIWLDSVLPLGDSWAAGFGHDVNYAVMTDVRFPDEAKRILDLGGEVWRIDADKRQGVNQDEHASEAQLAPEYITLTIHNNGTLDELRSMVERVL